MTEDEDDAIVLAVGNRVPVREIAQNHDSSRIQKRFRSGAENQTISNGRSAFEHLYAASYLRKPRNELGFTCGCPRFQANCQIPVTGDPAGMRAPLFGAKDEPSFSRVRVRGICKMVVQRRETSTPYSSCPTTEIQAPVEVVWALLTEPTGWGSFFDVRVDRIDPPGPAMVGQRIEGESGPRLLHLKLVFQFTGIDVEKYPLMLDVKLPFGITVREDLYCTPIDVDKCRVDYRCEFGFLTGWRGTLARLLTHRERNAGPINSLSRLKRAAEQRYVDSRMNSGTRTP